jgi:hypothetical protein
MTNPEYHDFFPINAVEDSIPIRRDPERINARLVRPSSLVGLIAEFTDPLMDEPPTDRAACGLRSWR